MTMLERAEILSLPIGIFLSCRLDCTRS